MVDLLVVQDARKAFEAFKAVVYQLRGAFGPGDFASEFLHRCGIPLSAPFLWGLSPLLQRGQLVLRDASAVR